MLTKYLDSVNGFVTIELEKDGYACYETCVCTGKRRISVFYCKHIFERLFNCLNALQIFLNVTYVGIKKARLQKYV